MDLIRSVWFGVSAFFLFLFLAPLEAFEIVTNSGREKGESFAVMNLVHDSPFSCTEEINRYSEISKVECTIKKGVPAQPFTMSQTLFFRVETQVESGALKVLVYPLKRAKLFSIHTDLKSGNPVIEEQTPLAKHWQIVGFEKNLPFLSPLKVKGINFPIALASVATPTIGALGIDKKPLQVEPRSDTPLYLDAKGLIEKGAYKEALDIVDMALETYPDTLFKRDFLLFRIRAMAAIDNREEWEDLAVIAKAWVSAYPADPGLPEVLYVLAKTYSNLRFLDEARIYYERLFSEYKGSDFELRAKIVVADELLKRGDTRRAPQIYREVLEASGSIEVASLAAVGLINHYTREKNFSEASALLKKVLQANPELFFKQPAQSFEMIKEWADRGFYSGAAEVSERLTVEPLEDSRLDELALKSAGIWYDESGDVPSAYRLYNRYEERYPKKSGMEEVRSRRDKLLFANPEEGNATKQLERFDYIARTYPGSEDAKLAYTKKAELLNHLGRYQEVLDMQSLLDANNTSLANSATQLIRAALKKEDCREASRYLQSFQKVSLSQGELLEGFDCLMDSALFQQAALLAEQGVSVEDLAVRLEWLYRYAVVLDRVLNFPRAALAARDTLTLADSMKNPLRRDVAFILFRALAKENRQEEARGIFVRLQREFPDDARMIEVYRMLLLWSAQKEDDVASEIYAKQLLRLQKMHSRAEFSPWAELTYIEALVRLNRLKDAMTITAELLRGRLDDESSIKVLYLRGSMALKLGESGVAKESFEQCAAIQRESAWRSLCRDSLGVLKP